MMSQHKAGPGAEDGEKQYWECKPLLNIAQKCDKLSFVNFHTIVLKMF